MDNETIDTFMVAEDAKRVERAAINSGKSISDFITDVLVEVAAREAANG